VIMVGVETEGRGALVVAGCVIRGMTAMDRRFIIGLSVGPI
jgi:hypothetical protein